MRLPSPSIGRMPHELARLATGNLPTSSLAFGKTSHVADSSKVEVLNEFLAVGDAGGNVTIWDLKTRMPITFCRGSPRSIMTLAFSQDGTLLASGGREEARLWDVASGQLLMRLRDPLGMDYLTGLAFSPDGQRLAISSLGVFYAPSITIWELSPDRGLNRLAGLSGQIETISVSPNGKRLAALAQDWNVGLWDLESGNLLAIFGAPTGVHADNAALSFSHVPGPIREFGRKLPRPVPFFDEHSPANVELNEIGQFYGEWRARQGSNLRPPA